MLGSLTLGGIHFVHFHENPDDENVVCSHGMVENFILALGVGDSCVPFSCSEIDMEISFYSKSFNKIKVVLKIAAHTLSIVINQNIPI